MVVPINLSSCNSLNIFEYSRCLIVEIHFIDIHENAFLYMLHFNKFPTNFLIILILQLKKKIKPYKLRFSVLLSKILYVMFFCFCNYIDRVSVFNLLISSSCAFNFLLFIFLL